MVLKYIIRFGLYLILIVGISKYTNMICTVLEIPKDGNIIILLLTSWAVWFLLLSCMAIGIIGTYIINFFLDFEDRI